MQRIDIRSVPLWRNLFCQRPQRTLREGLDLAQPRFEAVPPCDTRIHIVASEDAPQRRIGKIPFTGVKTISLVDKRSCKLSLARPLPERRLAPIGVAGPFVQRQYPGKIANIA